MGIKVENEKGQTIVYLFDECSVAQAAEIKAAVMEAMETSQKMQFDLHGVETVDVTMLQIVCAAHLEAQGRSVAFDCRLNSEAVASLIDEAGFQRQEPCSLDRSGYCAFIAGAGKKQKS